MTHEVKTRISASTPKGVTIKGEYLDDLIGRATFGDVVYLLMMEKLPEDHEGEMIEAMLVSCVDHGLNAPSVHVTRTVASCGVPVSTAVAAGISAIGEHHGGAGEACAQLLTTALEANPDQDIPTIAQRVVNERRSKKMKLPGFGHRLYKEADPRAEKLFALAREWKVAGRAVSLILAIQKAWEVETGHHLSINIDGAQGAILADMGIPHQQAKGVFLIGRAAGLNAHAIEEIDRGKPFKFAAPITTKYTGKNPPKGS